MNWHERYIVQAGWTRELRTYLFRQVGLSSAKRVLEVGCGTGAILSEDLEHNTDLLPNNTRYGLDISGIALSECQLHVPDALLTCGDALSLPYMDGSFDITYCHYLLLWVKDPAEALHEMMRVTRAHGHIMALAEPDYTARVDKPQVISTLGKLQNESLINQGADVALGSRLADLFYQVGITIRETGMIKNRGIKEQTYQEWQNEWKVMQADLAGTITAKELQEIKNLDELALRRGEHEVNVPTYFAWGQV
jgi:ubiquinone/menaquinone biosynthesis C-methylase UbiE